MVMGPLFLHYNTRMLTRSYIVANPKESKILRSKLNLDKGTVGDKRHQLRELVNESWARFTSGFAEFQKTKRAPLTMLGQVNQKNKVLSIEGWPTNDDGSFKSIKWLKKHELEMLLQEAIVFTYKVNNTHCSYPLDHVLKLTRRMGALGLFQAA